MLTFIKFPRGLGFDSVQITEPRRETPRDVAMGTTYDVRHTNDYLPEMCLETARYI